MTNGAVAEPIRDWRDSEIPTPLGDSHVQGDSCDGRGPDRVTVQSGINVTQLLPECLQSAASKRGMTFCRRALVSMALPPIIGPTLTWVLFRFGTTARRIRLACADQVTSVAPTCRSLGQELLEPGVLVLELFEPLGVVGLHAPLLVAPAVKRLLGGLEVPSDRRDVGSFG
jgi:hypothetical protein